MDLPVENSSQMEKMMSQRITRRAFAKVGTAATLAMTSLETTSAKGAQPPASGTQNATDVDNRPPAVGRKGTKARKVRIAAFSDTRDKFSRSVRENLDWTCEMIDRIAPQKPDIIVLMETFNTLRSPVNHPQGAERPDGETIRRMGGKAREIGSYMICPYTERRGNHIFNTAAVLDREGKYIGCYDKRHPTKGEIDDWIVPGQEKPGVIKTDFGKIAIQICFDANWPEDWWDLKKAGAEIIFFCSAYPAGRLLNAMATVFNVPIVSAAYPPWTCRIVDRDGLQVAKQGVYQQWVFGEIDLDNPLFHLDYHVEKLNRIRRDFGPDVEIKIYEEEAWWRVIPKRDDLDILDIIREYELEPLEEYRKRSLRQQDEARKANRELP